MGTSEPAVKIEEQEGPVVVNGADDPRNDSTTSVGVYKEKVDAMHTTKDKEKNTVEDEVKDIVIDETSKPPVEEKKPDVKAEVKADEDKATAQADKDAADKAEADRIAKENAEKEHKAKLESKDDRRFAVITKARRTAEAAVVTLSERLKKLEEENDKLRRAVPAPDEPKAEDFESDKDYYKALAEWTVKKELKDAKDKEAQHTVDTTEQQAVAEMDEESEVVMTNGREKYNDFNTIVLGNEKLDITPVMVEAALLSDIAADIFYYLGCNPDKATEISKMTPLKIARELTSIERELKKEQEGKPPLSEAHDGTEGKPDLKDAKDKEKEKAAEKKITKAPEPIKPPSAPGIAEEDPNKMSPKEYRAWRERNKS
jgi:hypothetical protein